MTMEKDTAESFCKVIGGVDRGVNLFQMEEVAFDPFTKSEVFDIDVASTSSWFLSITHSSTAVVVFVCNGHSFLRNAQIPEDAVDEKRNTFNVAHSHEFGLCGGEGNGWLELGHVCNRAAGKLNEYPAEGAVGFDAGGPVGVAISHSNGRVMIWTLVNEKVFVVAVDLREGGVQ